MDEAKKIVIEFYDILLRGLDGCSSRRLTACLEQLILNRCLKGEIFYLKIKTRNGVCHV